MVVKGPAYAHGTTRLAALPNQGRIMPQLELTYFNAAGRAEPLRVAFHITGLPFADHRVDYAGFGALKSEGKLPLGSVPVLDVDGLRVTQTGAMLRYVARLGESDLYPADLHDALLVDSVVDTFNDTLLNALGPSLFERDPTKKLEMRMAFVQGPMARACSYVESLVARSGGPFVLGKMMSIADLVVANQVLSFQSGRIDGVTHDTLAPYPHLRALTEAYLADPRVQAYRAKG